MGNRRPTEQLHHCWEGAIVSDMESNISVGMQGGPLDQKQQISWAKTNGSCSASFGTASCHTTWRAEELSPRTNPVPQEGNGWLLTRWSDYTSTVVLSLPCCPGSRWCPAAPGCRCCRRDCRATPWRCPRASPCRRPPQTGRPPAASHVTHIHLIIYFSRTESVITAGLCRHPSWK